MIQLDLFNSETGARASAEISDQDAPAFRSALEEIRNEVGGRLAGSHRFAKEAALTRAIGALGRVAAAVNKVITREDPDYE